MDRLAVGISRQHEDRKSSFYFECDAVVIRKRSNIPGARPNPQGSLYVKGNVCITQTGVREQ
jgi:hypothetical protein